MAEITTDVIYWMERMKAIAVGNNYVLLQFVETNWPKKGGMMA